jgi:AraC family transcriptional regulator, transcriptional activator of pobA
VRPDGGVPHFFIYGEPPREVDLGFVHVETIQARGHIHRGEVRPHRHGRLHQLMLWTAGEGTYFLDDQAIAFRAPALGLIPAGVPHGFSASPNCDALVVSVSEDFMSDVLGEGGPRPLGQLLQPTMLDLAEAELASLDLARLFEAIEREYRWSALGREVAIAAHVKLLILAAARLRGSRTDAAQALRPQSKLAERFQALLEVHHGEDWTVRDYAATLGATPYLLNTAIKARSGCTAGAAIAERRLTEAKRQLLYSDQTVSEIADALGYSSPGYICRFFLKQTGETAATWRRRRLTGGA